MSSFIEFIFGGLLRKKTGKWLVSVSGGGDDIRGLCLEKTFDTKEEAEKEEKKWNKKNWAHIYEVIEERV